MPHVLNRASAGLPTGAVFVGRPTKWGNPFSHLQGTTARYCAGSRNEAVDLYATWLRDEMAAGRLDPVELRGRDLVCWCAPKRCHADILLQYANGGHL